MCEVEHQALSYVKVLSKTHLLSYEIKICPVILHNPTDLTAYFSWQSIGLAFQRS